MASYTPQRRKVLTLNERIEVIKLAKYRSARKIAKELGVGKTQIQSILKNREAIIEGYENNVPGDLKHRRRTTGNEDINDLVFDWYIEAAKMKVPITGPLIKMRAREIAASFGNTTFKGSTGWLTSFTKRHNISLPSKPKVSGRSNDVDSDDDNRLEWDCDVSGCDVRDYNMTLRSLCGISTHVNSAEVNTGNRESKEDDNNRTLGSEGGGSLKGNHDGVVNTASGSKCADSDHDDDDDDDDDDVSLEMTCTTSEYSDADETLIDIQGQEGFLEKSHENPTGKSLALTITYELRRSSPSPSHVSMDVTSAGGLSAAHVSMADSSDQSEAADIKVPVTEIILSRLDRVMTRKSTQFSLASWDCWRERMKFAEQDEPIPDFHTACSYDVEKLDALLTKYVNEVKCRDGQEYMEDSLRGLIHGLQRYMKCYCEHHHRQHVIFMKNYEHFPQFSQAFKKRLLDCRSRSHPVKNQKGITKMQEESLWEGGMFGIDSAEALSDTMFFYFVKIFEITAATSLRQLLPEDFVFSSDEHGDFVELNLEFALRSVIGEPLSHYNYCLQMPDTSKLRHYCDPKNPRSFYNLIRFYMELIKLIPRFDNFGFFLTPKAGLQFHSIAIGKKMLQKKFAGLMRTAGYTGNFTTQAMVQSYIPLLQQSGYRLKKTQTYTPQERLDISKLLDPPEGPVNTIRIERVFDDCLKEQQPSTASSSQASLPGTSTSGNECLTIDKAMTPEIPLHNSLKRIAESNKQFAQLPGPHNMPKRFTLVPLLIRPNVPATVASVQGSGTTTSPMPPPRVSHITHSVPPSTLQAPAKPCFPSPVIIQPRLANTQLPVNIVTATSQQVTSSPLGVHSSAGPKADDYSDSEIDDIERIISEAVKQEPIEFEYDITKEAEAILSTHDEKPNKPDHCPTQSNQALRIKRQCETTNDEPNPNKRKKLGDTTKDHTAVIEYSVTNCPSKNCFKHEISVLDDEQTSFSFNSTNKVGKTMSDLDVNLGDYLPDNCIIRPGDIDLKRITLADGGMFKLTVKYSIQK